jgi:hypothetical protein
MTPDDPNFPHEEYALLIGSTAPGTARKLHSSQTATQSSVDVALADIMCDIRPSGVVLPKILRRKLNVMKSIQALHPDADLNVHDVVSPSGDDHAVDDVVDMDVDANANADGSGSANAEADAEGKENENDKSTGKAADQTNAPANANAKTKTEAEAPTNEKEKTKKAISSGQKQLTQSLLALQEMSRIPLLDRIAHYDAKRLHSKSPIAQTRLNYDQVLLEHDNANAAEDIASHLPKYYETPRSYRNIRRSRVFTTSELEKNLSRANAALIDIQKQLVRGEDIYFQDTDLHGNIYKGWEAFIDAKPEHIGIQDIDHVPYDEFTALAPTTVSSAPSRKIHAESRWFSSSSYSVENGNIRKNDKKKKGSKKNPTGLSSKNSSPIPPMKRLASPHTTTSRSPKNFASVSEFERQMDIGTSMSSTSTSLSSSMSSHPVRKASSMMDKSQVPPFFPRKTEPRTERSYVPTATMSSSAPVRSTSKAVDKKTEVRSAASTPISTVAPVPAPTPAQDTVSASASAPESKPTSKSTSTTDTSKKHDAKQETKDTDTNTILDNTSDNGDNADAGAGADDVDMEMDVSTSQKEDSKESIDKSDKTMKDSDPSQESIKKSEEVKKDGTTEGGDEKDKNEEIPIEEKTTDDDADSKTVDDKDVDNSKDKESKGKKRSRNEMEDASSVGAESDDVPNTPKSDEVNVDSDTRSSSRLRKRRS